MARRCLAARRIGQSVSIDGFAVCFRDTRRPELIEREVKTLAGVQTGAANEDLNDHGEVRHDPAMASPARNPVSARI